MADIQQVKDAIVKISGALRENADRLIELDQQVGDGDLGITAGKIANALDAYLETAGDETDIGKEACLYGLTCST